MNRQNPPEVMEAWQEAVQAEAKTSPWFAALLLQKGNQLFARFAHFYAQLRAMPRKMRRQLKVSLATAALILALSSAPTPAHAASITVTPGAAGIVNGDGCSLVEAIINANNNAATHAECAAGSGADTIVLAGGTYSYTTTHDLDVALPNITSVITIEGNGATIARVAGSPDFRLLRVTATGNLTLNNSTVTGGRTTIVGGGISVNYGTLTLNNSTVSGNETTGSGGGIYARGNNSVTLNNSTVSGNTAASGGGFFIPMPGVPAWSITVTLNNSTITGNQATSAGGGGIRQRSSTVILNRSIVSGNSGPSHQEIWREGGTMTADNFNLFGQSGITNAQAFTGFTPGANDITATSDGTTPAALTSILNTTLADNGGPTFTHALVTGSPAIDLIPTTDPDCNPPATTDQRGAVRADGVNRGGAACDAGAFEFDSNETPTAVTLASFTSSTGSAGWLAALMLTITAVTAKLLAPFRKKRNTGAA